MSRLKRLRRRVLLLRRRERSDLKAYRLTRARRKAARHEYEAAKLGPTLGQRALNEARKLIGVTEQGGNNTGPTVDKIILANGGLIGEPWCGDFVSYCYRAAGSKAISRAWASVAALRGLAGIVPAEHPKPGDLVRFTFDHVGLFVKDNGDGTITTVEGNTGSSGAVSDSHAGHDGVKEKVRAKSLVRDYLHVTK